MCGIVGYLGPQNPKIVLINGLRALEYRGYDSAGVAIWHRGQFKRVRAEGKLSELEQKIKNDLFDGHVGIGHTRWATHGPPSERNAHPHCVGGINLVHNGIIENCVELRAELQSSGAVFESDTDSEVVAHLIAQKLQQKKSLLKAVLDVVPRLRGAYAILVVSQDEPDHIVAFKNGPPLVVGVNEQEVIIASDIQAIVQLTKNILYLNDDEVLNVQGPAVEILDIHGMRQDRVFKEIDWDQDHAEKAGFEHFMLKEIFEQPRSVAQALAPHIDLRNQAVQLGEVEALLTSADRLYFVACGTSFYAALCGKYLIERMARVPVDCDIASEFRYRNPIVSTKTVVVVISQSGETADTLAALRWARQQGVRTMSICNARHSTIDREADGHLYMNSGVEVGVASTKAFSSTLAILNVLAVGLARARNTISMDQEKSLINELLALPSHMETVLAYDKFFREAAERLKAFKGFLYMGRGIHYAIALEGALKLKELAYMHAEGYAAGEMKHGPLALIDNKMAVVVLAPHDELFEKTLSNLEEVRARGGQILAVGTGVNEKLAQSSLYFLKLPDVSWFAMPILEVIPMQLLAYHLAASMGHDVDQPRNLAKSVTVE